MSSTRSNADFQIVLYFPPAQTRRVSQDVSPAQLKSSDEFNIFILYAAI